MRCRCRSDRGAGRLALVVLLWLLAGFSGNAGAATLRVAPLQVNLDLKQPIGRVEIFNDGSTETLVDLRVLAWTQAGERDQLNPTQDVVAYPPVARIAAGKQQVVRVGFRRPELVGAVERAYRLVVTELPPAGGAKSTLQFQLRLLIPVFVAPRAVASSPPPLRLRQGQGQWRLEASNPGNVHLKITSVALRDAQQRTLLSAPVTAYLLPGSTGSTPIPSQQVPGTVAAAQALVLRGADPKPETLPVELP
jgi:fimbrial chaperone protein